MHLESFIIKRVYKNFNKLKAKIMQHLQSKMVLTFLEHYFIFNLWIIIFLKGLISLKPFMMIN